MQIEQKIVTFVKNGRMSAPLLLTTWQPIVQVIHGDSGVYLKKTGDVYCTLHKYEEKWRNKTPWSHFQRIILPRRTIR